MRVSLYKGARSQKLEKESKNFQLRASDFGLILHPMDQPAPLFIFQRIRYIFQNFIFQLVNKFLFHITSMDDHAYFPDRPGFNKVF